MPDTYSLATTPTMIQEIEASASADRESSPKNVT